MHFSTALAAALAFASTGSAFVIDIYSSHDCTGDSRSVNVWDHTCATWMGGFSSYKPQVYGGKHQKSYFFSPGNCGDLTAAVHKKWVDGGGGDFQVGNCYDFGGPGYSMNAIASYRG